MLIEFSVSNFRSIREKQTLSMVASRDDSLPGNLIHRSLPGLSNTSFLKSVVLYGANASGKSNVLKAIRFVSSMVEDSAAGLKPGDPFDFEPFRFDLDSSDKPSEFEMTFVSGDVRYQYAFTVDRKRVHSEWLCAYPSGKAQCWFERTINNDGSYTWEFNQKHFKGAKESLAHQTRNNALFLSTAAQFNHERLLPVYSWFREGFLVFDPASPQDDFTLQRTGSWALAQEGFRSQILAMLRNADLGILDAVVDEEEIDETKIPERLPVDLRELLRDALSRRVRFLHRVSGRNEPMMMELDSESAGTLKYFSLLAIWISALELGRILAVDELGGNIHPLLVRALLKTAHSKRDNPNGAQMILTTHDVTLLDRETFRRDQVWFTEKDANAATRLYPLTDFQPRKDEALARGYLAGRYGAIPFLTGELAL